MIGQTISHYKILDRLGGGGMGVVYKAQDLKLDRLVALKFLAPDLSRDPEAKQRFVHEAKAASALQHNNICVDYDIDETQDGQMFISMEFLEGETLKKKIERGPIKVEEAIDITIGVAHGLTKAHEHAIVHRDIKPANIMVTTDGVVKIVDFGLAKLTGQARLTRTGSGIGTVAYMSPEQAQGGEVDHRTDIWSLGVILFEMLTGHLPFRGEHEAAFLYSVVHENPQSISSFRSDVPRAVVAVIGKALQKDPGQRYQAVTELLNDLKSASASTTKLRKQEKSIVVLPFEDLSPDRDQEYFSDGLTEEIISDLSNVRALRVISRSSAMTFKGTKKRIPEIAGEVNVRYVLEGSVRKAGNSLRITAQLIDGANDAHLWAEKYTGTLDDIFEIQEKVSRAIVGALKLEILSEEESHALGKKPTEDIEAYELYLLGRYHYGKFSVEGLNRALDYFDQAIQRDRGYALAYAGKADAYNWLATQGLPASEALEKGKVAALKALALDEALAEAHTAMGIVRMLEWDWKGAEQEYQRAIQLNPNLALARDAYASFLDAQGRSTEAIAEATGAIELDPLSTSLNWGLGACFYVAHEYDRAIEQLRKTLELDQNSVNSHSLLGWCFIMKGEMGEAVAEMLKMTSLDDSPWYTGQLACAYAISGKRDEAFRIMREWDTAPQPRYVAPSLRALVHLALGETDATLTWLEQACQAKDTYCRWLKVDPPWDSVRSHPRFQAILKKMGLVP
jgi:serine/threonine protein kinase/Flp pilus assembly protein TadD